MSGSAPVIVAFARTPIGKFRGSLSSLTAPQLGSIAIQGALSKLDPQIIVPQEAFMGNVVSAGIGQAPCRQAVLGSGRMPVSSICTTVNKVCASGMKSVMLASQAIQLNHISRGSNTSSIFLAGGMESMSNIPHYLTQSRSGVALGHGKLVDGVIHDGLWDVYNDQHMGMCAEKCAKDYIISREEQDAYAMESYRRAQAALKEDIFINEVCAVPVPQRRGDPILVSRDEEPDSVDIERIPTLRPAFVKGEGGTVTAANASSLNDGACAMVLMSEAEALEKKLTPLARVLGYGDAAQDPVDFTTSPSLAIPVALENAGLKLSDVEYHEINEAFSVVALANMRLLNLDPTKVNVFGGAVALGHPIGMSGARIIGTLLTVLQAKDATIGCASICNGGGGASAIIIERLS